MKIFNIILDYDLDISIEKIWVIHTLGIPVFILRESAEYMKLGTAKLVGTNEENVFNEIFSIVYFKIRNFIKRCLKS